MKRSLLFFLSLTTVIFFLDCNSKKSDQTDVAAPTVSNMTVSVSGQTLSYSGTTLDKGISQYPGYNQWHIDFSKAQVIIYVATITQGSVYTSSNSSLKFYLNVPNNTNTYVNSSAGTDFSITATTVNANSVVFNFSGTLYDSGTSTPLTVSGTITTQFNTNVTNYNYSYDVNNNEIPVLSISSSNPVLHSSGHLNVMIVSSGNNIHTWEIKFVDAGSYKLSFDNFDVCTGSAELKNINTAQIYTSSLQSSAYTGTFNANDVVSVKITENSSYWSDSTRGLYTFTVSKQ